MEQIDRDRLWCSCGNTANAAACVVFMFREAFFRFDIAVGLYGFCISWMSSEPTSAEPSSVADNFHECTHCLSRLMARLRAQQAETAAEKAADVV